MWKTQLKVRESIPWQGTGIQSIARAGGVAFRSVERYLFISWLISCVGSNGAEMVCLAAKEVLVAMRFSAAEKKKHLCSVLLHTQRERERFFACLLYPLFFFPSDYFMAWSCFWNKTFMKCTGHFAFLSPNCMKTSIYRPNKFCKWALFWIHGLSSWVHTEYKEHSCIEVYAYFYTHSKARRSVGQRTNSLFSLRHSQKC